MGQAEVFEEIPTMDFPFEGIPTVPPRKDMDHMVRWFLALSVVAQQDYSVINELLLPQSFFCSGCRYRVTALPEWTAARVRLSDEALSFCGD